MPYTYRTRLFLHFWFFFFSVLSFHTIQAQDTMRELVLDTVVIRAFEHNRRLHDIPAAVNYLGAAALQRFSPASVVTAVNTTPGVRMEERSPGSYRLNIRGSALRSPFGVRNVKVYFNDIPFTDPGGNTYLNQLGFYDYRSLEIIKGPGSSLYGAGTGGVLMVQSIDESTAAGATIDYTIGSYGLQSIYAGYVQGNQNNRNRWSYQHLQSDGYRRHSNVRRDVLSWNGLYQWESGRELRTTLLAGDLYYQTPGALNANEFAADHRQARPAAGIFPGAEQARASIQQKTILAGLSYTQPVWNQLQNKTVMYAAYTQMNNPAIRNYGRNREPHGGLRTVFTWKPVLRQHAFTLYTGGEWQQGLATFSIHRNAAGRVDSLTTLDEVNNRQAFLFTNAVLDAGSLTFTAGTSINGSHIRFQQLFPAFAEQQKKFKPVLAPRFSVMQRFKKLNVYASIAKGFSPPSTTELLPTGSALNLDLVAEKGINYDFGVRTRLQHLFVDINAFYFSLTNTIVQRRTAGGGEYFINAGSTRQMGLEAQLRYPLFPEHAANGMAWASYTMHRFRYLDFKQQANDYSGNPLPGIAPHTVSAGVDAAVKNFFGTISYFFSSRIPLSDAHDVFADAYHLVHARLGYEKTIKAFLFRASLGADNLLNQLYSLGNDINGAGGRYFNAAAGRNYFVSLVAEWRGR